MKKYFVATILIFVGTLFISNIALAQEQSDANFVGPPTPSGFTALAPIPGLTDSSNTSVVDSKSLSSFFNNLYRYLIGVAAMLAIAMIIWGGVEIARGNDSVSQIMDGKGKIYNAILGLILVLSPVLVFTVINPSILNLSLNLPPLDTASNSLQTNNNPQNPVATSATECATTHVGQYLQAATCPTQALAEAYGPKCENGLRLSIAACTNHDPNNNNVCVDKNVKVYCSGKTLQLISYYYTHVFGMVAGTDQGVIPRDKQAETDFTAGCTADGGKVHKTYPALNGATCPADGQIPPGNVAACDVVLLSCASQ